MVELDTEIDRLRAKLTGLKPGIVDDALENAAPTIARVTSVLSLVQPLLPVLLPLLRPKTRQQAVTQRAATLARDAADLPRQAAEHLTEALPEYRWRRPTWAQRHSGKLAGLGVAIVLAGVAGLAWTRRGASARQG